MSDAARAWGLMAVLALVLAALHAAPPRHTCQRVDLQGEVRAGQEWRVALGQGWIFRMLPIASAQAGYSGWDLVIDRDPPAGYPDALLLATLPYNSINQREIGTTFGLRAQDAIGWNPRSFRFLMDPKAFSEAQWIYLSRVDGKPGICIRESGNHVSPARSRERRRSGTKMRLAMRDISRPKQARRTMLERLPGRGAVFERLRVVPQL